MDEIFPAFMEQNPKVKMIIVWLLTYVVWFIDVSEVLAAYVIRVIIKIMQAASISETSVNFYQTTQRNNLEESNLYTRRHDNLKSHLEPWSSWPCSQKSVRPCFVSVESSLSYYKFTLFLQDQM
jgi:hypothetical protein